MAESKVAGRLARQAARFAREHGGAQASVEYIGQRGARIVLVGEDGVWGDLMAPGYDVAEEAVAAAELPAVEDFGARVRTGPYEWSRMAGIQIGGHAGS